MVLGSPSIAVNPANPIVPDTNSPVGKDPPLKHRNGYDRLLQSVVTRVTKIHW